MPATITNFPFRASLSITITVKIERTGLAIFGRVPFVAHAKALTFDYSVFNCRTACSETNLDRRPHHPRQDSKRGNRYLFVQAAWVVLIKRRAGSVMGSSPDRGNKKRPLHNVLALRSPINWPA
jgi:hypothetical protein